MVESETDLVRHGDELVVTVGSYRRVIALPAVLPGTVVAGARLGPGAVVVRLPSEQGTAGAEEEVSHV